MEPVAIPAERLGSRAEDSLSLLRGPYLDEAWLLRFGEPNREDADGAIAVARKVLT